MIINVRGSNGAGKSTISRRLIDENPHEAVVEPKRLEGVIREGKRAGQAYAKNFKKENAFILAGGVVVCGRYQAGMDGYLPHETIEDTLRYWAQRPGVRHIIFENVLISGNAGTRWTNLFDELEQRWGHHPVLAILDTPQPECIRRVLQRRAEARAGGFKHRQSDEDLNYGAMKTHWKRVRRIGGINAERGYDVRWVDHRNAYEQVHDLLVREGGWKSPECMLQPDNPLLRWEPTAGDLAYLADTALLPGEPVPDGWMTRLTRVAKPTAAVHTTVSTVPEVHPLDDLGDPFEL